MTKEIEVKGMYKLVVGESEIDSKLCYKIINLEYGVVEIETKLLPQALKFLDEISAGLDAMSALLKEDIKNSLKTKDNVVGITK